MLHKEKNPARFWVPCSAHVTGLGNYRMDVQYEVPQENLIFEDVSIGMKFFIGDAPVDCILGSSFLSMLTPHGSCTINDKPGYFFTMPSTKLHPSRIIRLPFISEEFWQLGYLKCLVIVKCFNHVSGRAERHLYEETTPWELFSRTWHPRWLLRGSERMELGLPGFSRNTHPTVIPPQHILGQMCQQTVSTSRETLIDLGDINRLRVAETQWYDHNI